MTSEQKDLLLLYELELIDDPEIHEAIEEWIEVDPFAQQFLNRFDPDSIDTLPSTAPSIQKKIDSIARQAELELLTDEMVCRNLQFLDAEHRVVLSKPIEDTPFDRINATLAPAMAAKPRDETSSARKVESVRKRLIVNLTTGQIHVRCPARDLPSGLVWIYCTVPNGRLTRALVELRQSLINGSHWWTGQLSISALTDDKSNADSWFNLVPVNEVHIRDASTKTIIDSFVESIRSNDQREAFEAFCVSVNEDEAGE